MPTANKAAKAVFDNGKTSSYHINSLFSCQSGKTPSSAFRIVVHRGAGDGAHKRYEFEAENPKIASACGFITRWRGRFNLLTPDTRLDEIVQTIKALKSALERTGSTTSKTRRNKHLP
jgi:hypothetical protein